MFTEKTTEQFYRYLTDSISIEEFEQWIYATAELEEQMPWRYYLDLITFDFTYAGAKRELHALVTKLVVEFGDLEEFSRLHIRRLLQDLITEREDPILVAQECQSLLDYGFEFLRKIGALAYEFDDIPWLIQKPLWNAQAFAAKRKLLDRYIPTMKTEGRHLLQALDSGDIQPPALEDISIFHAVRYT